ncbi:MAG: metallophosphoesterase family protein [Terracidiphilus sp.]
MADTQWTSPDDGKNPYNCSIEIIRQVNEQFISHGVQFVVHVGDLCEWGGTEVGESIRAAFAQTLFNNKIGFFPLRGNHDDGAAVAAEFQLNYPQCANGVQNNTPSAVLHILNPDEASQPTPAVAGSTFTVGSNFSSPDPWGTGDLKGLSYSFDVNGSRFILLDQFTPPDSNANYNLWTTIAAQQSWITQQLTSRPAGGHAFVFGHFPLITEYNVGVLLGSDPSQNQAATDAFIESLAENGVHIYACGHDHMHDRTLVYTTDGRSASVMQVISQSDSSFFYKPLRPSLDQTYNVQKYGVARQVPIQQELCKVGYYLVTIDGSSATVEYWAANVSTAWNQANYEYEINTVPELNFTLRESYGYGLVGKQFQIPQGGSFTAVKDTSPNNNLAEILSGSNLSIEQDGSNRTLVRVVDIGWSTVSGLASDVLTLWGLQSGLGSEQCETYTLQMSFDPALLSTGSAADGTAGLATLDASGNWTNAVNSNYGGTKNFVAGPWESRYTLGSYGVDATNNVAWAVLNYGGPFAVTSSI